MFKIALVLVCIPALSYAGHNFNVVNRCNQIIWGATYGENEIPGNGGFRLAPGESYSFPVRDKWTGGRIWARTGCDANGMNCETGDCGATYCSWRTVFDSVTLAEFGLDSDFMGLDFWDISLVDGYNVPISIEPIAGTVQSGDKCHRISCNFDFNVCPNNFIQWGHNNNLAGCKSACSALREGQYCCPYDQGYGPDNCFPSDFSRIFKSQCYDAYSYAFDDDTSSFACISSTPYSSGYQVTFCP